jgi:hypothetical protein
MARRPAHDPRESPKHRKLLETPGSIAYLPSAFGWACRVEVVSLVLVYGFMLGAFAGYLTAMWIVLLLGSGAVAWLLAVVARAVWGFGDPPQLGAQQLITIGLDALRVMLVCAVATAGFFTLRGISPTVADVYAWVLGAMLPSFLVLLAVEDELFKALDPVRMLRLLVFGGPLGWVLAAGSAWAVHRGFGWVAFLVTDAMNLAVIQATPPSAERVLTGIGVLWGTAFVLHWYGHALHHRHDAAGLGVILDVASDEEKAARRCEDAVDARMAAVDRLMAAEDRVGLLRLLQCDAPDEVDELEYRRAIWERLLQRRLYPAAVKAALPLLEVATRRKLYPLAAEVWIEAKRLSPTFDPGDEVRSRLQAMAAASRDERVLASLSATVDG